MIRNWRQRELCMSFEGIIPHPSDIDLFVLKGSTLIIGEIKNEKGVLKDGQRELLEKVVDGWKHKAILLFIVHDKYVEYGDKIVEVADCQVVEYYYKRQWHEPKEYLRVKDAIEKFC